MKPSLTFLYLLFIAMAGWLNTNAQSQDSFSTDIPVFQEELEAYMTAGKLKSMEDLYKEFDKEVVKTGAYTGEQWGLIHQTASTMLKRKMTTSPYFSGYLQVLMVLHKQEEAVQVFNDWHDIYAQLLAGTEGNRFSPVKQFLDFTPPFYREKALRYSKLNTNWAAVNGEGKLSYREGQLLVEYEKTDLLASRLEDSIYLYETKGVYYPLENLWKGEGGKVTWARYGNPEIYCELGPYQINMTKSFYEVYQAKLQHPKYFPNRLIAGKFEDKVISVRSDSSGSYPRFVSFDTLLRIDNIGQGVAFEGGFRLQGTTVYGFGSRERPARIDISDQTGQRVFTGLSRNFAIRQGERIGSRQVESAIYFGIDSLYHPSLNLRYDIQERKFNLKRNEEGTGRNPFFDSYHQVNIDVETVDWIVGSDSLQVGKKTIGFSETRGQAEFESLKYYEEADYRRLQNIGSVNPIATFKIAVREEGTNFISDEILAQRLNSRFNAKSIQSLLYDMVARGFVNYNAESGIVEIKDKVFHYADASLDRVDFDVLRIRSDAQKTANATLGMESMNFLINAVENVEFSPVQKVALKPAAGQVVLKENRNMDFDGRVFAGFSVFEGKDYHFNYNDFAIDMDSVRYFDLFIPSGETDRRGNPTALSIASRIEHVEGSLLIDAPQNKAGRTDIPMFPSFNSTSPSYVFYDKPSIQDGCYQRDSFYFEVAPFHFHSLDNYTRQDVTFDGKIVSADIFPDIDETLELQEDESLGVQTETPPEGLIMYLGKGVYTGAMSLSNEGFLGQGNLKYLGTSIFSDDFIYKPKQLLCSAEEFNLEEDRRDPEFPKAYGVDVNIDWRPYKDSMYIRSAEFPFDIYAETGYKLDGTLILTPEALRADGVLDWPLAILSSDDLAMGAYSAFADSSTIQIKSLQDPEKIALANRNVESDLDFDEAMGRFEARSGLVVTELPNNQYETSMNAFDWDIEGEKVIFRTSENSLSDFLSTDPRRDSLTFKGETAAYDLRTNELQIGGVPYIISCDALIYPDSGKVVIESGGQMRTLDSARIVASLENKNHVINRSSITIDGHKYYKGSGYYEYNIGKRDQEILFDNIVGQRVGGGQRSEKKTETRGTGEVTEEDGFYIDHKTEFAGTISLFATSKALLFDGFARMDVPDMPGRVWFSLNSPGDKSDLTIQFDEPKTYSGEPVRAGLYLSKETAEVYPRVMMPLFFRKDRPIIDTRGYFKYDEDADKFLFGDSTKVLVDGKRGNFMSYNARDGQMKLEGKMKLGSGLDYVKVTAAGTAETRFRGQGAPGGSEDGENSMALDSTGAPIPMSAFTGLATEVEMDVMAGLEFFLPDKLATIILTDLNASTFSASPVSHTPLGFYEKALAEVLPEDEKLYQQVMGDLRLANDLNIPRKSNPYTLLFSKLPLRWNPEFQSWFSRRDDLGLASINGTPINRMLRAYVEFKMPSNNDDRVYIYFETPGGYFYFFGYKQGILNTTSNNPTYTDAVLELKKKESLVKMDDGGFYEIQAVDQGSARAFVNRVKEGRK